MQTVPILHSAGLVVLRGAVFLLVLRVLLLGLILLGLLLGVILLIVLMKTHGCFLLD